MFAFTSIFIYIQWNIPQEGECVRTMVYIPHVSVHVYSNYMQRKEIIQPKLSIITYLVRQR